MLEGAPKRKTSAAEHPAGNREPRHAAKHEAPSPNRTATAVSSGAATDGCACRSSATMCEPALETIREILWQRVGIVREGRELQRAVTRLGSTEPPRPGKPSRRAWETHNIWTLAQAIARSALAREESRGSHYRLDFPYPDDERFGKHPVISCDGTVRFE